MEEKRFVDSSPIKLDDLDLSVVFKTVLQPLKLTFAICFIILIVLAVPSGIWGLSQDVKYSTILCELNTCILPAPLYIGFVAFLVIVTLYLFLIFPERRMKNQKIKFGILIIGSLFILFGLVFLSGGILDSPFTGAVGVYVASYFVVQERKDLKKINSIVLFVVILLTIAPYLCFFLNPFCVEKYLIRWKLTDLTNFLRVILAVILTGIAGYFSFQVNNDLTKELYEKNRISSD